MKNPDDKALIKKVVYLRRKKHDIRSIAAACGITRDRVVEILNAGVG